TAGPRRGRRRTHRGRSGAASRRDAEISRTCCLRPRLTASSLTRGAPIGDPGTVALRMRADRRAAAPARAAGAAVDAMERARSRCGGRHQTVGRLEDRTQLHLADARPRRDPRLPQRLGAPDVPDAGDEALVEERFTDRAAVRAQERDHGLVVGLLGEDVGADPDGPVELEDGAVPEHRLVLGAAEDEPRTARAGGPERTDAPAAGHAQVAPQDVPALEAEQQVLADRLHRFE